MGKSRNEVSTCKIMQSLYIWDLIESLCIVGLRLMSGVYLHCPSGFSKCSCNFVPFVHWQKSLFFFSKNCLKTCEPVAMNRSSEHQSIAATITAPGQQSLIVLTFIFISNHSVCNIIKFFSQYLLSTLCMKVGLCMLSCLFFFVRPL